MPVGAMAAQLAHAVGQSVDGPHPDGCYVVVLAARDEAHLRAEADRLEARGVPIARVVETDGALAGQLTAVGLRPGRKRELGRFVSCLPLLREEPARLKVTRLPPSQIVLPPEEA